MPIAFDSWVLRESRSTPICRIRDVAEILQDGSYQLTVNGETLLLQLVNGRWSIEEKPVSTS
jgi:hypothetical protein